MRHDDISIISKNPKVQFVSAGGNVIYIEEVSIKKDQGNLPMVYCISLFALMSERLQGKHIVACETNNL